MARIIKNSFLNFLVFLVTFSLVGSWWFSGWPQIWQNPKIPPKIQETKAATEAVHYHERITSQQAVSATGLTTVMTISAAELIGAGFAVNDEVLILVWAMFSAASSNELQWQITYNGAEITNATNPRLDFGAAGRERTAQWMGRQSLGGTVSDIDLDIASLTSGTNVYLQKAEIVVIRLSDFGVENTDWFWNKSTTAVTHTTTYSATNRAAVTWDPASAEDWVALAYMQIAVNATAANMEAQLMLDSGLVAGDFSEEGESATEERTFILFDIASLDENSHSYTLESREDTAPTTYNQHRESAIFVFRKAIWSDIFSNEPSTVSVANATDVQAATITDSLSGAQNVVILGEGELNIDTVSQNVYLWVRQGGSTIIDPVIDASTGLSNAWSFDATDELHATVLSYQSLSSGAQDLDLFVHHTGGSTENFLYPKFLLWGMSLAVNDPPSLTVSTPPLEGASVTVGDTYNITYTLSDDEEEVFASFFYDTDGSGLDGTAITGCEAKGEGTDFICSWDTTGVTPDDYYIYATTTDGVNSEVSDYSSGMLTISIAVATVSCSSNISSTTFSTWTDTSIKTSSPNASTTMSCSGTSDGCTLYIKDAGSGADPGLWNSSDSSLIESPNAAYSTTAVLSAGTEGYGIQATTTSAGLGIATRYNQTGNTVGGLTITNQTLASSTADISGAQVIMTHKAAISGSTYSGTYTDTITYECVLN